MKAHVRKVSGQPGETVLLYCVEEEKAQKIRRILEGYSITVLTADESDSGETLGALFGLPDFPRNPEAQPVPEAAREALFFAGFQRGRLDLILTRIKAAGVTAPFKAVLTPNNQGWSMSQLLGELTKEHETFAKLDQLAALCRQLTKYDPNKLTEQQRGEALEALAKGRSILKRPAGVSPDTVDMTIAALQRAVASAMVGAMNNP